MLNLIFKKIYSKFFIKKIGTITNVITKKPFIALTFDDGPDIDTTPKILKVLNKFNAQATFFMVGDNANRYPGIIESVVKEGHVVGNHSWDHPSFPLISSKERRKQICDCEKILSRYTHKLFRPPYGDQNLYSRLDPLLLGFKVITWNVLANDWENSDTECVVDRLVKTVGPGDIVLLHDTLYTVSKDMRERNHQTIEILEKFFLNIGSKFRFVSVPELFREGAPNYVNWSQKPDIQFLNELNGIRNSPSRKYIIK